MTIRAGFAFGYDSTCATAVMTGEVMFMVKDMVEVMGNVVVMLIIRVMNSGQSSMQVRV